MDDDVKIQAFATAEAQVRRLGDLRRFLQWCDLHKVSDTAELDWGDRGHVYVTIAESDEGYMIGCADHAVDEMMYDVLIPRHAHATEQGNVEVPRYDWITKDRIEEERRKFDGSIYESWRYADDHGLR